MTEMIWQKSSYSGSGQNDCIELGSVGRTTRLRESDTPEAVLVPGPASLHALLARIKREGAFVR